MDLELTPEQKDLRVVAEEMLSRRSPPSLSRRYLEGEGDFESLSREFAELGWYAVGLDESDPFGLTGLALLTEQCGRHVTPNVLVDTAVAARLAAPLAGADTGIVGRIARGEATTALCALEAESGWTLGNVRTALSPAHVPGSLSGDKLGVQHATNVEALAVVADVQGTIGVVFVPADSPGLSIAPQRGIDPSSAPCRVLLEDVDVLDGHVLAGPGAADALALGLAAGAVATAAEAVGASSEALRMAIEYSRERHQFGRPIGTFQALRHLMADLFIQQETAWASILYAAAALDEGLPDGLEAAAIAKAHASRATRTVVEGALQIFGGIAFTWEHDAHLLQRRVLACERRFGDALHHEQVLGAQLGTKEG